MFFNHVSQFIGLLIDFTAPHGTASVGGTFAGVQLLAVLEPLVKIQFLFAAATPKTFEDFTNLNGFELNATFGQKVFKLRGRKQVVCGNVVLCGHHFGHQYTLLGEI